MDNADALREKCPQCGGSGPLQDDVRMCSLCHQERAQLPCCPDCNALRAQVAELQAQVASCWEHNRTMEPCPHRSLTGVDTSEAPDKVWRCDVCGGYYRWVQIPGKESGTHTPAWDYVQAQLAESQQQVQAVQRCITLIRNIKTMREEDDPPPPSDWCQGFDDAVNTVRQSIDHNISGAGLAQMRAEQQQVQAARDILAWVTAAEAVVYAATDVAGELSECEVHPGSGKCAAHNYARPCPVPALRSALAALPAKEEK